MIDAAHELGLIVRSRQAFVVIDAVEEDRIEQVLGSVARQEGLPLYIWSLTRGLRRSGTLTRRERGRSLAQALDEARRLPQEAVYFFKDLPGQLQDQEVVRRLLDLARHFRMDRRTLVMAGPGLEVPEALRPLTARWRLPLPGEEDLRRMMQQVVRHFTATDDVEVALGDEDERRLLDGLRGLSWAEAENALRRSLADDGVLSTTDVEDVHALRRRVLRDGGVLTYVPPQKSLEEVAGLDRLKAWLARRREAFSEEARAFGLPPPRGVLLLGVQGCGKSLVAGALASDWNLPLLRMEAGRLYDKYIGESEKHLDRALEAAGHLAPCVLLVDEIEKAFGRSGSDEADGGLSRRILGRWLGWLQDRPAPVFVVATCNDATSLPPELMRKGRFDEIFFVDLPDPAEREAIFAVHLKARDRNPADFDLRALADAAPDFSGAEIEQAVVSALYAAFAERGDLDTATLLEELGATQPLAVTRREDVERLRAWARGRAVPAGGPPA